MLKVPRRAVDVWVHEFRTGRGTRLGTEQHRGEDGLTLVELVVAMFILAIMLSGLASFLMTSARASFDNERRAQATGVVNQIHETLQASPWPDAVLYEEELGPLADLGANLTAGTFEDEDLVTIAGPSCPAEDPDCRIETVPRAYEAISIGGRDYEVYRAITWTTPAGADAEAIRRFTTVVRWEVLGETVEHRLDSTRAPTPGEVDTSSPPGVQFLVSPSEVQLDEEGRNESNIGLNVDFTGLGEISEAEVLFRHAGLDDDDEAESIDLARVDATQRFTGTIPAGEHVWEPGSTTFLVAGQAGVSPITTTAAITFTEPLENADPSPDQPVITEVNPTRQSVTVGRKESRFPRLCDGFDIEARIDGLGDDYEVTVSFKPGGSASVPMDPVSTPVESSSALFRAEFPQFSDSDWTPAAGSPLTDVFTVVARSGGTASEPKSSAEVTFTRATGPGQSGNENC